MVCVCRQNNLIESIYSMITNHNHSWRSNFLVDDGDDDDGNVYLCVCKQ